MSVFLPNEYCNFPIIEINQVSLDTIRLVCSLPSSYSVIGTNVSSSIRIRKPLSGSSYEESASYTITSTNRVYGKFELVVKVYPTGNVSKYIGERKVGDTLEIRGPFDKYIYTVNSKRVISMVAGGSGIAPMLQIIREILENPNDNTQLHLLFGNHTVEDIIMKHDLDLLAKSHVNRLALSYFITSNPTNAPLDNNMFIGHINIENMRLLLPSASADHFVYVCGPPGMMNAICGKKEKTPQGKVQGPVSGHLKSLGFTSDMVYKF
jgi:cytochrome-b5 reductase